MSRKIRKRRVAFELLLLGFIMSAMQAVAQRQELQGYYRYPSRNSPSKRNPGYRSVYIHTTKNGEYLFSLNIVGEHPIYTTYGQIYGKLTLNPTTGHYEYLPPDPAKGCKLEFIRQEDRLVVKTLAGNCGFHEGISADGTIVLQDSSNPDYFDYRDGKVSFSNTPPESFHFEFKWGDLLGSLDRILLNYCEQGILQDLRISPVIL